MAVIRKLSPEVIGQIAAGEVVERPAAAVKELVENSIDAGAKNITVELRDGGIRYLRVSDNGHGIPAEQIRMAFERHATSKISESKDLFDIQTLGFRGEALASIAAVSKVTCTTRTREADFGTRAVVEAGVFQDVRQAASPVGTTIVAENLFFNAPVRLKFLKKPAAEAALVSDYMLRLILSRPEIAFRFVSAGKTVYRSTGDGKIESALYAIYGREAFQQMIRVSGHMNGVLVNGYVGVGELARGNRQQQSFFVNGRYFRSAALSAALERGAEGRVMVGRFPICALFLEVPRQQVDVNVHPNKLEVRFQNEPAVAGAIETIVSEAMHAQSLSSSLLAAREDTPAVQKPAFSVTELAGAETVPASLPQGEQTAAQATPVAHESAAMPQENPAAQQKPVAPLSEEAIAQAVRQLPKAVIPPMMRSSMQESMAPAAIADVMGAMTRKAAVEEVASRQATEERQAGAAHRTASERPVLPAQPVSSPLPSAGMSQPTQSAQQVLPAQPAKAAPSETYGAESAEAHSEAITQQKTVPETPSVPKAVAPEGEQTVLAAVEEAEVPLRLAGILFHTYWVFEVNDRLLLVDQHAAHERMLYDRMMARFENERVSQTLLTPQVIQLTPYDMALVAEFAPVLAEAGFEVEPFDSRCVALRAIPTFFGQNDSPRELLLEALGEWQAGRGQVTRERLRRRVAQMACKRAIKGGDELSEAEIRGFLRDMLRSDSMPTCPHGRPIVIEITRYQLEKRFKRIQ